MKKPVLNKILIAAVALLALVPGVASAATDAFTIYAYGSGNVLRQIFEGMKGFVDDPGYRRMVQVLVLLTLIYVMVKGYLFNRPSPIPIVGLIVGVFMLQILLFSDGARTEIHIEDQVHAEDYLVSDMPIALAAPAAFTSEVSRYMVKLVETFYMGPSIPIEMRMSENNTYNFANKIISALRTTTISDPMTKATFNSYIRECVVPEMYQGRIRLDTLLEAPPDQFWGSLFANNKARMSICFQHCAGMNPNDPCPAQPANGCPDPYINTGALSSTLTAKDWREGLMVACDAGHPALQRRIEALIGATAFNELGNTLLRDSSLLDGAVSSTILHITGVTGATGTEHFMRAGMMNMFRESSASVIANGGSPGLIQVLGTEQAKAVQRTNWMVAADVFAESVAYLWSTLQAFIFAIFPIAVFLFLFPGLGPKALAGYFGLLAWISLWMPFLAVINFLSISWLVEDIRQLAMTNLSYASLLPISDAAANMQSITNFLGTMVPVLTYGMVRGGEFALTQFAGDASAPRASESASSQIASKSFNYGSISANNVGMNKFDGTTSFATGYDAVTDKNGVGAAVNLTPRSASTTSLAGAPDLVQASAGKKGTTADAAALGLSAGQSVELAMSTTDQAMKSAQMLASSGAVSEQSASALKEASTAAAEALAVSKAQSTAYGDAVSTGVGSKFRTNEAVAVNTSGAIVAAAVAAGGAASAAGLFEPREGQTKAEALKELGAKGKIAEDEKEADKFISAVQSDVAAFKKENPNASPEQIGRMVQNSMLAATTSAEDLDKLQGKDGGAALINEEDRSFIDKMADGAKKLGGAALVAGSAAGAGIGTAITQNPAYKKLGLDSVIQTNTSSQFGGGLSNDVEVDQKNSADKKTTNQVSDGTTYTNLSRYADARQDVNKNTNALQASLTAAASTVDGVTVSDKKSGSIILTATNTASTEDSASMNATMSYGRDNAVLEGGQMGRDLVARTNNGLSNIPKDIDAVGEKVAARAGEARSGYDGVAAQTEGAGNRNGNVSIPNLAPGAAAQVVGALNGKEPPKAAAPDAPAPLGQAFTGQQLAAEKGAAIGAQDAEFDRVAGGTKKSLEKVGADVRSYVGNVTLSDGPTGAKDAQKEGEKLGYKAEATAGK